MNYEGISAEIYNLGCSIYGDRRGKGRFIEIADKVEKLEQQIKKLEAQLKTAYGYGCDGGKPPWM